MPQRARNVALGLTLGRGGEELLRPWARNVGAISNEDWITAGLAEDGPFVDRFHQALTRCLSSGGRIMFNLERTASPHGVAVPWPGNPFEHGFTNWELQQILHNDNYYRNTTFYLGGQPLSLEPHGNLALSCAAANGRLQLFAGVRRRAHGMKELAQKLLHYYERLVRQDGGRWQASAEVARTWLSLIEQPAPSKAAVEALLAQLDSTGLCRGSAWYEMKTGVALDRTGGTKPTVGARRDLWRASRNRVASGRHLPSRHAGTMAEIAVGGR